MSVYEFERNIYPDLNPTTPQEPHTYRLNKLSKTEAYFLNEIEVREQNAKKVKHSIQSQVVVDTGLITSTVITGGISCSICQWCSIACWYCLEWN